MGWKVAALVLAAVAFLISLGAMIVNALAWPIEQALGYREPGWLLTARPTGGMLVFVAFLAMLFCMIFASCAVLLHVFDQPKSPPTN